MAEDVPYLLNKIDPQTQRGDGSMKGSGWLGPFTLPSGEEVTEYSIGIDIDGKEMDIPTLVPGMTDKEIKGVLTAAEYGEFPSQALVAKAVAHARKMIAQGKSPFAQQPANSVQMPQQM